MSGRPRKRLIAKMRESVSDAEVLLQAYDRVLDDLSDNDIRWAPINRRRNQIDSDLRRLIGEIVMLESKEPLR